MSIANSLLQSKSIQHLGTYAKEFLSKYNIKGKMLEVGGSGISPGGFQPEQHKIDYWGMEYTNLDFRNDEQPHTIIGDICKAPFEDKTFDFVFSADTFEHIIEPWVAAKEMCRILKPGGLCFVYTLFSWRYHCSPIDYWRFSPACLAYLFKDLECLEANWDSKNRRQDHRGSNNEEKWHDSVPLDNLGGWRENWRVFFMGRKNG